MKATLNNFYSMVRVCLIILYRARVCGSILESFLKEKDKEEVRKSMVKVFSMRVILKTTLSTEKVWKW